MTFYTYSVHFQVKYVVTSYEFLAQNQACTNNRVCNCDLNDSLIMEIFICLLLFTGFNCCVSQISNSLIGLSEKKNILLYRFEISSSFHNLNLRKLLVVKVQRATKRYYVVNVYCLPEKERVRNELFFINELY